MDAIFEDILLQALELARWAPSSHNSQPWKVFMFSEPDTAARLFPKWRTKDGEQCLLLTLDGSRRLKALPSLECEMYLSCGMFFALICMGLTAQNLSWRIHWPDEDEMTAEGSAFESGSGCRILALLSVSLPDRHLKNASPTPEFDQLSGLVRTRHCCRAPFSELLPEDLHRLEQLLTPQWPKALTGDGLHIGIEQGPNLIRRCAELVSRYAALDFSEHRVWKETYRYLRFDTAEETEDGLYLHSLFGPMNGAYRLLLRFLLSPTMMQVLKRLGATKVLADQLGQLVAETPRLLFCFVEQQQPSATALVQSGARLMELWLKAQSLNLALHPISVMLQHDHVRQELEQMAGVDGRLVFFARLGPIASPCGDSPRRPLNKIFSVIRDPDDISSKAT